ncbi:MAG: hypothetical protein UU25_C0031G0012 [Microgenomates group bacterium GW2011_GWB1_40_9]|nr:MAG: hypothetical protein UT26_C0047G0010 [Microgenomates group bacterium GW2011_GWC1_39_12]KKR78790.1 MAG: hypothetical protein UU25_C0031G0012 [Microgenomates group bacterium GW2011_GWB1_40_9]
MNKTIIALSIATVALGGILLYPKAAEAYRGDPSIKGPYYTEERHEAMEKAFETKDYNAWKNLMQGRGRVTQVVNQGNFAKFAQAHELAEAGKQEEAAAIRAELGLGLHGRWSK